jgi:hypothetical protein
MTIFFYDYDNDIYTSYPLSRFLLFCVALFIHLFFFAVLFFNSFLSLGSCASCNIIYTYRGPLGPHLIPCTYIQRHLSFVLVVISNVYAICTMPSKGLES